MNTEEIKTGNEVIARWMGWERYSHNSFKCPNLYPIENNASSGWTTFNTDQLEFASRWDWIMPVCAKWDSINFSEFNEADKNRYMQLCDDLDEIVARYEIQPVFDQLVKNINWYTSNKK
jgi:hypothetical protein